MATADTSHFVQLTELAGVEISMEQLQRMHTRYVWALPYCQGGDVLEVACGSGQGLDLLSNAAKSVSAGDYSAEVLETPRRVYGDRFTLKQFDAQSIPFPDKSFDAVLIYEALYYVPSADKFFAEAQRILRPGGHLLIATANKDLFDFNPSPHSHEYLGVRELASRLQRFGFTTEFFGDTPVTNVSMRQRILRPVKAAAVRLGVMPKTNDSKVWLKRLMFGQMTRMPDILVRGAAAYTPPQRVNADAPDRVHKVILCAAKLSS